MFLKLKPWLLFFMLICSPLASSILASSQEEIVRYGAFANIISLVIYGLWLWCIVSFLSRNGAAYHLIVFKGCWFFAIMVFAIYNLNTFAFADISATTGEVSIPEVLKILLSFAFFSLLICLWIVSKLLKREEQSTAQDSSMVFYFILFLLFPIGVWVLQPKVNRVYQLKHL
jgi:hypothetical protein